LANQAVKEFFDDIFSRFDTMLDGRTDRQLVTA